MTDPTISHYRVLEELGSGGMGVVYRAEDTRLGRAVALKFLPAHLVTQAASMQRFAQEARVTSALNHPHICTVYDIGEHDGRPFIVMELLEGTTLRDVIAGQPLPLRRLIDLAIQIADALEAAHTRAILHRDVKPANVFVSSRDHIKVLDFGIAKLVRARPAAVGRNGDEVTPSDPQLGITDPGVLPGTLAYMSPEQARGEPLDVRSDLFSFGSVLYEMATGQRAFPGSVPGVIADKLLNRAPVPPAELNPSLVDSPELLSIIEKALDKDRELRYQSAGDVLADLRRIKRRLDSGPVARPRMGPRIGRRALVVGSSIVVILGAGAVAVRQYRTVRSRDSVVLAEFVNRTGEPLFDYTLRQGLAVQLSQSPYLSIVPDERLRETLRLMGRPADASLTQAVALEICRRQGVKAMIDGSIASLGRLYVVALQATQCDTGEPIAREQAEVPNKEGVLQIVGSLASKMRSTLGESLASIQRFDAPLEQITTPSLEALRAYTMGQRRRTTGEEIEAIPFFLRAIELDSNFAQAYTSLSNSYSNLGETERAREYAKLAYQRRERVSERERLFITYQYHDIVTGNQLLAIQTLELWKEAFPREFQPVNSLAFIDNFLGRFERAIPEAEEAIRRNPGHGFPYSNLAQAYRGLGRYSEARRVAERAVALKVETLPTRRLLYQLAVMAGDDAEAARQLEWARGKPREFDMIGAQAQVAAHAGRLDEARRLNNDVIRRAELAGLPEVATGNLARASWGELVFGNTERARDIARAVLARRPSDEALLVVALTLALTGSPSQAQRIADSIAAAHPQHTVIQSIFVPLVRAGIALSAQRPADALYQLQKTAPYDGGFAAAHAPLYLRGQAYLMNGEASKAASEFQRLLDHRGANPFSPFHAVAPLWLARARVAAGDVAGARQAYERFFESWKDADPDGPVLVHARDEYRRLGQSKATP
ncbi:MAG TPA: protein kinase [Gemmatimonadales bacterium]|nr:protein kinase [Gemmatimonadales bacterium]